MPSIEQLIVATHRFFEAFSSATHPLALLTYFSTTNPISIQHYPSTCTHPQSSLLRGPNAIRSYFDLIATHWTRSDLHQKTISADPATGKVVLEGSIVWTWKKSGRRWTEDFTCTLVFDDLLKIVSFVVKTESPPATCVMRAVDSDPRILERSTVRVAVNVNDCVVVLGLGLIPPTTLERTFKTIRVPALISSFLPRPRRRSVRLTINITNPKLLGPSTSPRSIE
ncbi:hypothetical protein Hypma_016446 [Hypsizygus marmoreus]|uniref:Uncharacterized protein n=1 Tax=Hypsizygus marmoreus TaxID=39966 RepID=A0A369IXW5_HYPMA|nr:hypothetical protein Hypma_016446 [Hypsizygus marmoreus]